MAVVRWSALQSLATPAGTATFNGTNPTLWPDPKRCVGGGMGQMRAAIDLKPQDHGYLLHPDWYEEGAHFLIAGLVLADTESAADTLADNLKTYLRSIRSATGTLSFGSYGNATVRCDVGVDFPTWEGNVKSFVFGVVSATPF